MTINTNVVTSGPYTGTGSADTYNYTFKVLSSSELVVVETTDLNVASVLVEGTHYTVTGVGNNGGGSAVRTTNLPNNYTWFMYRVTPRLQPTDFTGQGSFVPLSHENALDKITMIAQEVDDSLGRAIRVAQGGLALTPLTKEATGLSGKFPQFQANGDIGLADTATLLQNPSNSFAAMSTIATLQGSTSATITSVFVEGYYAAGDGYGGWFVLDPADTTSSDNGGNIILDSQGTPGRWKRELNGEIVNLGHFGAVLDGTTDDTTALTNAIANATHLKLPAGILLYDPALTSATLKTFEGVGSDSVLRPSGIASSDLATLTLSGDDCTIKNMHLDCQNLTDFQCVKMTGARARAFNVSMSDMRAGGSDVTGDTDGSTAVITGMTDTSDFTVNGEIIISAGFPAPAPMTQHTILSKTASTITVSVNSDSVQSNVTCSDGTLSGTIAGLQFGGTQFLSYGCSARDFSNTGAANASHPRCISILAGCVDGKVRSFDANLIQAGISITSGATRIGLSNIDLRGCIDNGIYDLGSGALTIGDYVYHGRNEALALVSTNGASVANLIYRLDGTAASGSASSAISINDITNVVVDHLDFEALRTDAPLSEPTAFRTRSMNTASDGFTINSMTYRGNGDGIGTMANGTVDNVTIRNVNGDHHWFTGQQKEIFTLRGNQFHFENWNLRVIDDTSTLTSADNFDLDLPASTTSASFITNVRIIPQGPFGIITSNMNQLKIYTRNNERQEGFKSFNDGDTSPAVEFHTMWQTANTAPTVINDFDRGSIGDEKFILINDTNTTIDFTVGTSNLRGNVGADWVPTTNDHMRCTCLDGTIWACEISDNTI